MPKRKISYKYHVQTYASHFKFSQLDGSSIPLLHGFEYLPLIVTASGTTKLHTIIREQPG